MGHTNIARMLLRSGADRCRKDEVGIIHASNGAITPYAFYCNINSFIDRMEEQLYTMQQLMAIH